MIETVLVCLVGILESQVQDNGTPRPPRPQGPPRAHASEWKTDGRVRGNLRFNSNVWLLDSDAQDRLESDRTSDRTSGRYKDMESVEDVIFTPGGRYHAAGPSPLGRRLSFWADAEYSFYIQNSRRSNLETNVGVGQYAGPDGHLQLSLNFIPQYFERNYLADAFDVNGDGSISSSERQYEHGDYLEWDLALEYRHRIVDRTKSQEFGLDGHVTVGFRDRNFNSPFRGHDETGPWLQLMLRFQVGTGLKWGLRYKYEDLSSPTEREVQILDEPDFGVDLNGDLDIADQNVRTYEAVDRTRVEQEIGFTFGVDLGPKTELDFLYTRTTRDYASDEVFDVGHRDREDKRNDFGLSLRGRPSASWEWRFGIQVRRHDTDRAANPDLSGDAFDYWRLILLAAMTYRW